MKGNVEIGISQKRKEVIIMLENLFANAGAKIKNYAKTLFVIESIVAILGGLLLLIEDEDMILAGIFVAGIGIFVAYLSSLFLAAFGDLVQSNVDNKAINEQILAKLNEKAQ